MLSATNPENGTVSYTYNSDQTLNTKTDAKGQVFTYLYDSYKRLITIKLGSTVLRTFIYDTNTLDSSYSGSYTAGRLVAVQNAAFTPQGYVPGQGGSNVTVPSSIQFVEMYNYTQAGLTAGKRLQAQETFHWYVNNVLQTSNQTLNMDGTYTYDTGGEGKIASVNYPTTYSFNGTTLVPNTGPTYTYSFDAMYRPTGLTDQNSNTLVNNVSYNPANQLLTFNTETRTYNNLNQMTRLTITGSAPLDITYNFPAGANNGKISSQKDNLSVETVTYQYDSLNRLISASSSQSWSETYGFDAFGNLLSKTGVGGAPTLSQSVNTATNQIVGQTYDSNGNQSSGPLGAVTYDAENRIASMSSGGVQYAYDSRNKRVWSSTLTGGNLSQFFYYYGMDGQKLAIYPMSLVLINNVTPLMTDNTNIKLSQFFGSKRIGTFDRLGTAKYDQQNGAPMSFYPYGEDRGTVQSNDSLKFATYTRDAATGLDYADQRYYANNFGRFMSPDPYSASGGPGSPASWNRYSYTRGDPANRFDPNGLQDCDPENPCPDGNPGDPGQPGPGCDPSRLRSKGTQDPCSTPAGSGGKQTPITPTYRYLDPTSLDNWQAALQLALKALANQGCAQYFNTSGTGISPVQALEDVADSTNNKDFLFLGIATVTNNYAGETYWQGYQVNPPNGSYYYGNFASTRGVLAINPTAWNSYTVTVDAGILIHELGHLYDMVVGLGGSAFVNDANPNGSSNPQAEATNAKLEANCLGPVT